MRPPQCLLEKRKAPQCFPRAGITIAGSVAKAVFCLGYTVYINSQPKWRPDDRISSASPPPRTMWRVWVEVLPASLQGQIWDRRGRDRRQNRSRLHLRSERSYWERRLRQLMVPGEKKAGRTRNPKKTMTTTSGSRTPITKSGSLHTGNLTRKTMKRIVSTGRSTRRWINVGR